MPTSNNPDWINWRNSAAREIILEDLEPGGALYQQLHLSDTDIFEFYQLLPEFHDVVWSQFKERMTGYRKQINGRQIKSKEEERMLAHDRQLYPRQTHNERGELVFDMTPAKALLREDVKNKVHTKMKPRELQASRPEYAPFKPEIFRHRIYQEERLQKYLAYLDKKRKEKRIKFAEDALKKATKRTAEAKKQQTTVEKAARTAGASKRTRPKANQNAKKKSRP